MKFFIVFIALIYSLIGLFPTVYRQTQTPPNTVNLGAEKYYPDYYLYLNFLKQGQRGQWFLSNDYTSEKLSPTPIHAEYLIMGKIGKLFNLPTFLTFHLSRFILNFIFVLILFWFLRLILNTYYLILPAAILSLFYTGPFSTYFFSPPDFLARATLDPHHILGEIFTLLTIGSLITNNIFLLIISSLALSYFFTTGVLIIFVAALPYLLIIKQKKDYILMIIFSAPLLFFIFYLFKTNPSLINIGGWEKLFALNDAKEPILKILSSYFLFFLPLWPFVFLGIRHKNNNLLIISYILMHFVFFAFLFLPLDISRSRMWRLPFMVFFAILSVNGLETIRRKNKIIGLLVYLFIGLLVFLQYPKIIQRELSYGRQDNSVYIPKPVFNALNNLSDQTKYTDVIWAEEYFSTMIPGISGNTVFLGHFVNTIDFEEKKNLSPEDASPYVDYILNNDLNLVKVK